MIQTLSSQYCGCGDEHLLTVIRQQSNYQYGDLGPTSFSSNVQKISPFYSTLAKYEISSEAWYPYIASQSHTRMEWLHLNLSFIFWLRVNHVQNISRPFLSSGFKWTFQKSNRPLNANFHPSVILVNFFFPSCWVASAFPQHQMITWRCKISLQLFMSFSSSGYTFI